MLSGTLALAQNPPGPGQSPAAVASPQPAVAPNTLLDGTPVKLRLAETVSSATAKAGQQVPFEVVEEVQVQGVVVIPKGATALATVVDADHKKTMGRGGKLDLNIDSVRLLDNEKATLRATAGGKGGGHTGAMTGAMVATGILFFPAAPLFLFIHGKDITLPKGMETTAFIEGDTKLNLAAFSAPGDPESPQGAAARAMSQVTIEANIPDCDISVDGAFTGSTPSQLALLNGKHEIAVHKRGYVDWTRTLSVSGGAVRLHAELQPETAAN